LAKNCLFLLHFCYPSLIWSPRSLCSPWNFAVKSSALETRVKGLSSSEDRMILAGVVLAWYRSVTDGQTDGQTESIIAETALCIASYADALSKIYGNSRRCEIAIVEERMGTNSTVNGQHAFSMSFYCTWTRPTLFYAFMYHRLTFAFNDLLTLASDDAIRIIV